MPDCTFIHAADLHLGAPFKGLDAATSDAFAMPGGRGNLLAEAGFAALDRLERVCLEQGADFLILSGDIYDDKDGVLRARFALRDMFRRLNDAGIRVFIAHGNHDPLRSGPEPVTWPDNVTVFGKDAECFCVSRDNSPLALVQGISHGHARETENLALRFERYVPDKNRDKPVFANVPENVPADVFQIAVLHCAVGGVGEGHAPYAPCSLGDLTGAGFDYWALGHVHQGKILCEKPYVVYPGSVQGMHVNETGLHGCRAVRVTENGVTADLVPLAPVVWEKIRFGLDATSASQDASVTSQGASVTSLDALVDALSGMLEEKAAREFENLADKPAALFCRVILEGNTDLDAELRRPGNGAALLERLRGELCAHTGAVRVWVKDIVPATAPARDFGALADRDDLVGEIVRLAAGLRNDPKRARDMADLASASISGNAKLKKILTGGSSAMDPADDEDAAALADEARSLLCSLLEDEA